MATHDEFHVIAGKVDTVSQQVARVEQRLFFGSPGDEALITRVRILEEVVVEERRKDRRTWTLVVATIGLLSAVVGGVLVAWLTIGF